MSANGEKVYLRESLDYVRQKVNSTSKFNSIEIVPFHKTVQTKNMVLDITKLKKLGYIPKYNLFQNFGYTPINPTIWSLCIEANLSKVVARKVKCCINK
jgi:hypothetical protein